MTQQAFADYVRAVRTLYLEQPDWYLSGAAMVYDYVTNDSSQYVKALASLGAEVHRSLSFGTGDCTDGAQLLCRVYDPHNPYHFNYNAYRFVLAVLAEATGEKLTGLAPESMDDAFYDLTAVRRAHPTPYAKRLTAYQGRLLDLSRSNPLVHLPAARRGTLTLSAPHIDEVLPLLSRNERVCLVTDPRQTVQTHMCFVGEAQELSRTVDSLYRRAISLERNFGLHAVSVACGFLCWRSAAGQSYRTPLLLVKGSLVREKQQGNCYFLPEQDADEPICQNLTLSRMLSEYRATLSISLPHYAQGMSYRDYCTVVMQTLKAHPECADWYIEDAATLGLFHYQRAQLEQDLGTHFDTYLAHPYIRMLCGAHAPLVADPPTVDSDDFLVLDADKSQCEAIEAALRGESFLLQGPPGTGKSRTLTNIIAGAMAQGKTVLFVTEKASARNIIYENLSQIALDGTHRLTDFVYHTPALAAYTKRGAGKGTDESVGKEAFARFYNARFADRSVPNLPRPARHTAVHAQGRIERLYEGLMQVRDGGSAATLIDAWAHYAQYPALAFSCEGMTEQRCQALEDDLCTYYRFVSRFGLSPTLHPLYGYTEQDPRLPSLAKMEHIRRARADLDATLYELASVTGVTFASYDAAKEGVPLVRRLAALPKEVLSWISPEQAQQAQELYAVLREKHTYARGRAQTHAWAQAQRAKARDFCATVRPDCYDSDFAALAQELAAYRNPFYRLSADYRAVRHALCTTLQATPSKQTYRALAALLSRFLTGQSAYRACREHEELFARDREAFPSVADGWDTDFASVCQILERGCHCLSLWEQSLTQPLVSYLYGAKNYAPATEYLLHTADRIETQYDTLRAQTDALCGVFDAQVFDVARSSLQACQDKIDSVLHYRDELADWSAQQAFWARRAQDKQFLALTDALAQAKILQKEIALGALRRTYYEEHLHSALRAQGASLAAFRSEEHEGTLTQYARADEERIAQNALRTYTTLCEKKQKACAPFVRRNKLIASVRGHAVRDLISQYWESIRAITPCFMMSPLAVSQYLDIGLSFDLVLFDEASQIFTEEALASLVRAKQVILSGDRQQLPPRDFFRAVENDSDDEEEPTPSVLDAFAQSAMREISLKWHYRSRDAALIRFSNAHFYENSLITFPAAGGIGAPCLQYHFVPDATYGAGSTRVNVAEADAVVAALWEQISDPQRAHLTLGVVAFSVAQAQLIERRFEAFVKESIERQAIFGQWEAQPPQQREPLVFCNLDTVQGEERDCVLVSTTYAPDAKGAFALSYLGPMRTERGAKRLNVAITRAKEYLTVVTSLSPALLREQLAKSSGAHNEGAALLCAFLESVQAEQMGAQKRKQTAPHGLLWEICRILDEQGIAYDLGVGDFRCGVEIGIKRTPDAQAYLLGIVTDTDGLGTQSVREYARLRAQVLRQRYGWELHFVWQLSWLLDYENEKKRLLTRIRQLMEN